MASSSRRLVGHHSIFVQILGGGGGARPLWGVKRNAKSPTRLVPRRTDVRTWQSRSFGGTADNPLTRFLYFSANVKTVTSSQRVWS